MGPRDLENGTIEVARRDTFEKTNIEQINVVQKISDLLKEIQENLFSKAKAFRDDHITEVNSFEEFKKVLKEKGGFVLAHWDGTIETEKRIKELTKASLRCIPLDAKEEKGVCVLTGKPSNKRVIFAKAY